MNDEALLAEIGATYGSPFWEHTGIEAISAGGGEGIVRLTVEPHLENFAGNAHGGVIATVVDAACGLAARSIRTTEDVRARPHVTTDLHVQYLAPGGGELTGRGKVLQAGRNTVFCTAEVYDGDRLVARGSVTFMLRQPRPGSPSQDGS